MSLADPDLDADAIESLYARGVTDNKGELMSRVWGVEAYLATLGRLPCRVRFLVEGEEEYGSGHLDQLLDLRPGIRKVEGALIEGGGVDLVGQPEIVGGVRGIIVVELFVKSIAYDAHSSLATVLPSAPARLIQALATFWNEDGQPAVDGLNDGVLPPTPAQVAIVDSTSTAGPIQARRTRWARAMSSGRSASSRAASSSARGRSTGSRASRSRSAAARSGTGVEGIGA